MNTYKVTRETKHIGTVYDWGFGFKRNLVPVSPTQPHPRSPSRSRTGRKACAGLLGCFLSWKLDGKLGLQPEPRLPPTSSPMSQLPNLVSCLFYVR